MSPWTILAWIVLAALYAAVCVGAWLLGKFLGWPDWPVPAVGVGLIALALLFAIIKRVATSPETPPAVTPGMQTLTPAMAALTPPRELARRWRDFLPLLGKGDAPVFLALGEEDALRRRLWLSTPECRCIRDDASGLSFAVYPDSVWVDVPAAFVAAPAGEPGQPAVAAGAPGLWEELLRFLPALPGELRGVLVFVDSRQDPEAAAQNSRWLAGKLNALAARFRKHPPALWIASSRLENFPGGRRLAEKLAAAGDGGRALLGEAFGASVAPPRPLRGTAGSAAFAACLEKLDSELAAFIAAGDAAGQNDALSPEAHLLRHSLSAMTRNAKTVCAALAGEGRAKTMPLGGVFLCGGGAAGQSLPFAAALPRSLVPGLTQTHRRTYGKPHAVRYALAWILLAATAAGLAILHFRAEGHIDALPFRLLEASPNPGGFGGTPPVARYAQARAELDRLSRSHALARLIFHAPNRGLAAAEKLFADNLRSWLPASDDPALIDAWLDGLAEWVEARRGIAPLSFATLSDRRLARIRGAHSGAGRAAAAKLLTEWRTLPDEPARAKIDLLQARYDERLHADWRRNGADILAATLDAAHTDDFAVTRDFIASDPGFTFVAKAGEELKFPGSEKSEWAKAAMAIAGLNRDLASDAEASPLARLRETALAAQRALHAEDAEGAETAHRENATAKLRTYRSALAALHPMSLDASALADLAANAYATPGGNPPPPSLTDVAAAWTALAAALPALEPSFAGAEGAEIAALLRSRHDLSFRAAVALAAKRIQEEWERLIRMPLASRDSDESLIFLLDEKPFAAFTEAAAKPFLAVRDNSLAPAAALGRAFPFHPEAIAWLNRTAAAVASLDREYPLRLTLLPVTAGKEPLVFPRGIRFTGNAAKDPVSATGYNNRVTASFVWSVRDSLGVEFAILFDAFTLEKKYPGAMGLVRFLRSLDKGRLVLSASAFPEQSKEWERCGVDQIAAHFAVHDPLGAANLDAELPPPPPEAIQFPLADSFRQRSALPRGSAFRGTVEREGS